MASSDSPLYASDAFKEVLHYEHTRRIWACAVSPDGRIVASSSKDHTARAFQVEGEEEIDLEQHYSCAVHDVSIGGGYIATAGYNGVVYVQKPSDPSANVMKKESEDEWARSAKLSPDGSKVAFSIDEKVFVANVATQETLFELDTGHFVVRLAANKDQTVVFILQKNLTIGSDNFLQVWDVTRGGLTPCPRVTIADTKDYPGIATNANGDLLAIADNDSLRLWEVGPSDPISLPRYSPPSEDCDCALTSDGKRLVASMGQQGFGLWDCETKAQLYETSEFSVVACAISDNGKTIVFGCEDLMVRVWSLKTTEENNEESVDNVLERLRELLLGEKGQAIKSELKKLISAL